MTDETQTQEDESEAWTPEPIMLAEGEFAIFNITDFSEATNSLAAMVNCGKLMVLRASDLKWLNVSEAAQKEASVVAIRNHS